MCVIIDANVAAKVFGRPVHYEYAPLWKWIEQRDGRIVYGGPNRRALAKLNIVWRRLKTLWAADLAYCARTIKPCKRTSRIATSFRRPRGRSTRRRTTRASWGTTGYVEREERGPERDSPYRRRSMIRVVALFAELSHRCLEQRLVGRAVQGVAHLAGFQRLQDVRVGHLEIDRCVAFQAGFVPL